MSVDRLAGLDRCRPALGMLASRADRDPLLLADLALMLVGEANREACDGRCSQEAWLDALLYLMATLTETVAAWSEVGYGDVLERLDVLLDARDFERVVLEGVWDLPELGE